MNEQVGKVQFIGVDWASPGADTNVFVVIEDGKLILAIYLSPLHENPCR